VEKACKFTEYGKCSEKCPFKIDVPEIIKENIAFFDSLKNR
jgi:predicted aldo/keto reductase-like oxidoreductase